jgi:hypothetical protein
LISFIPQAIFFFLFVWVIFKMLIVWRVMKTPEVNDQKKERAKIKKFQIWYFISWTFLWSVERALEYRIVKKEKNN